jgi:hypothetical protein
MLLRVCAAAERLKTNRFTSSTVAWSSSRPRRSNQRSATRIQTP